MWVFGYGSLLWKPNFPYVEAVPGQVFGYVRRFWQLSSEHRGTPDKPGRVVSLVREANGSCFGIAYRVAKEHVEETMDYLNMREGAGYRLERIMFYPEDGQEPFELSVYIGSDAKKVDNAYHGNLPTNEEEIVKTILMCRGQSGSNLEYALRLADCQRRLAPHIFDEHLFDIEHRLLEACEEAMVEDEILWKLNYKLSYLVVESVDQKPSPVELKAAANAVVNIDAGGKKPKKEEEPKPFVCAIYRRDIASFLSRAKIQQWRLTSSYNNASLIEFPSLLPRFKYPSLIVIFASSDRCRVKKDGFLGARSDHRSMHGEEFNSVFNFRFCCRNVKDSASKLAGQRLFPSKHDNEGVAFQLYVNRRTVVCRVPNLLTAKTAPAMLHFLHHLSQACYEYIEIFPGATASAAECALNPLVLQVLPKFRLRGVKFGAGYRGQLSSLAVEMASKMRIRFNLLFYYTFNFTGPALQQLLDFIANGRHLDKRLELKGSLHSRDVDQIIKHFEEDMHSLEGAIRDVRYETEMRRDDWPARCPRDAATQVTPKGDGMVDYRFDFTNAHSEEPFSLLLKTRRYDECERVLIVKFHLTFGSA